MLEDLHRVDWARLSDAYGSAEQVPEHIRGLLSPDAEVRKRALGSLHATICHQGSRYRASAPAVPFLLEVLQARDTPSRELILDLLIHLAVGYPENHLPFGFDPAKAFAPAEKLARKVDLEKLRAAEPDDEDEWDPGRVSVWERDAYEAVERRVDLLRELTGDEDEPVRRAAVRALAWFPRAAAGSAPVIREIARGGSSPGEAAGAVLCLGLLGRYLQELSDIPLFRSRLEPREPGSIRVAAAISLGVVLGKDLPPDALDALLQAVQHALGEDGADPLAAWHWCGAAGYAAELLALIRPKPTQPVVAALCRAAEADDTEARASVWQALLSVVFRRPKATRFVKDPAQGSGVRLVYLDPRNLTRNQARALHAIGRNPIWDRWDSLSDHHMDVCMAFGLPWRRADYQALVAAADSPTHPPPVTGRNPT